MVGGDGGVADDLHLVAGAGPRHAVVEVPGEAQAVAVVGQLEEVVAVVAVADLEDAHAHGLAVEVGGPARKVLEVGALDVDGELGVDVEDGEVLLLADEGVHGEALSGTICVHSMVMWSSPV